MELRPERCIKILREYHLIFIVPKAAARVSCSANKILGANVHILKIVDNCNRIIHQRLNLDMHNL